MGVTCEASAEPVAEGIVALGGWERADERISWLGAGARGWLPINCYLIGEGADALVIDAGVAAHEELVLRQLAEATAGVSRLSLLLSRLVEFDSIGNAAPIVNAAPVTRLIAHFPDADHIDGRPGSEGVDWVRVAAHLEGLDIPGAGADFVAEMIDEQKPVFVDVAGTRRLELMRAPLRLLLATWSLDVRTGTLFTSDAFGHVLLDDPSAGRVVDEDVDTATIEDVRRGLEGKFGWLFTADPTSTRDGLVALFERYDVHTIAPGSGAVLRGKAVVERHLGLVLEVLDEIAKEREA